MKPTYSRRYRRSASRRRDTAIFKKDTHQEQPFFSGPSPESFFKPTAAVQRKCDHCAAEEKSIKRIGETKEEEKKVQKMDEKKEEDKAVHKMGDTKEEEKKVQKMGEKKEEEKPVQKMDEKKEEQTIQRLGDTKEEEKKVQKMGEKKEEEKPVQKMDEKKEEDKTVHKMEEEKKVEKMVDKKEEEKKLDKKDAATSDTAGAQNSAYIHSLNGKGQSLPGDTKDFFQEKMGHDFSHVRIHTGTDAERSAKHLNAKAYTVDNNIVFNKGQYAPGSEHGDRLLAHELVHVVQNQKEGKVNRKGDAFEEKEKTIEITGRSTNSRNKTNHGCEGVEVAGQTDANYTDSFTSSGSTRASSTCTDCSAPDCVTARGTIVSEFRAHPVVTLPPVPGGLTVCEANAVRRFINTTLRTHELQHVAAFNTYNATIRTPYTFTGCQGELGSYLQSLHDSINATRMAASNARSDALDPFVRPIPCNCE